MSKKIIITSGLALFAMFFGAGNIIFPLALGAHAGTHIFYILPAFLLAGIGLPFLGLFAASLHQGNYHSFFNKLGKKPAFILITFLILIIGPLFGAPRTETVTFHTLRPFLPSFLANPFAFSAFYCFLILACTFRHSSIVDLIGKVLSPIKLLLFFILIMAGLGGEYHFIENSNLISSSITLGLVNGYSTMDLLAAFFFCSVVCQNILVKTKAQGIHSEQSLMRIFLLSCLVGGVLLGCVYTGFMLIAAKHATELQHVETAEMIMVISNLVLGKFGSLFVCICVAFACLVTAIALTEVATDFFYTQLFKKKISRFVCLISTIFSIYVMSMVGFTVIMKVALPILEVLYPILIGYCIFNLSSTLYGIRAKSLLCGSEFSQEECIK
jgi:LIVCS family branched-chain amino acid:cation transporter